MKTWIKFIIFPLFTLVLLSLIETFIMGYLFNTKPNGVASWVSGFILMTFVGSIIYQSAPNNKIVTSLLYFIVLIGIGVYADYLNDGQVTKVMGQTIKHQFNLGGHISDALGLIAGLWLILNTPESTNDEATS